MNLWQIAFNFNFNLVFFLIILGGWYAHEKPPAKTELAVKDWDGTANPILTCSPFGLFTKIILLKRLTHPQGATGFRFLTRPCRLWVRRMHICSVYFFVALFFWATKGGPFRSSLLLQPASICMVVFYVWEKIYVKKRRWSYLLS